MSLKLTFPTTALDGRVHREEELTLARTASQRQHPANSAEPETPVDTVDPPAMDTSPAAPPNPNRRRVALPDPVAFKFLEGDPSVTVVERRRVLPGYELYLVEQWACSRQSLTFVIVTYTGDPKHLVTVGILEVPAEEKDWSPRLRVYFRAIQQYHARPKETGVGELMVTNLSSFPSALTVIAVPEGDIRKYRHVFIINENLKRLGCSGRSGLTLTEPTPATQAKFMQLYKTSERIPFDQAVLELVKLCQLALYIFGVLEKEYADGLLCDVTEKAINDWWIEIGSEYFNIEPSDGILGPTTVAALLGTLFGARNRLSSYGAPVSKDVFDLESTKKGVETFQKSLKLERTRRLDRQTLLKLHRMTAKAAAGEGGWGVQKAVKSTVAEIGGKRGELVIGMVSGRDKANIGDIETLDLAKFISLAYGERPKWLWHGKPRRTLHDHEHDHPVPTFGKDSKGEIGLQRRIQSAPVEDELETKKREDSPVIYTSPKQTSSAPAAAETPFDKDALLRKTVFKSVAGKVSDARSGLGRIRDAVGGGLRGHVSRPSKDESPDTGLSGHSTPSIATLAHSSAALTSPVAVGKAFPWKVKSEENSLKDREGGESVSAITSSSVHEAEAQATDRAEEKQALTQAEFTEMAKEVRSANVSAPGSIMTDGDLRGPVLAAERSSDNALLSLQRQHSVDSLTSLSRRHNEARYPRRLSFSVAEEAVLGWDEIISITDTTDSASAAVLHSQAELAYSLYSQLQVMQTDLAPWVARKLAGVERLEGTFGAQQAELQALYAAARETYERMRHSSSEVVAEERARLAEAVKDVEVLVAKLEYEIGALVSRVNEVEDGVVQLEAQVEDVERRADELKTVLETESWLHWFVRTVTGIGTGPNITRGPTQKGRKAVRGGS
ncbi:Protein STB2 [Madurella mycetomatis]|uniref:Protein STB2 n=1 Tax=Madurella mycetomatis TaxID=100816 RepID=A0A175WEX5_9PEZI|nr:Protein STB2 [Madurella mycetomatis]KXX82243.1 Protein STB2 [Madurella mycetomatis]